MSRVCVRQALAILEADNAIVRQRGKGTFVRERHVPWPVVGVMRMLTDPPPGRAAAVRVLDVRRGGVGVSISGRLGVAEHDVLRVTTRWSLEALPFAIGVSFLPVEIFPWLEATLVGGRDLPSDVPDGLHIEHGDSQVAIEATACGQWESEALAIPPLSTLMVTTSAHVGVVGGTQRTFEVLRLGYRGDRVQLQFHGEPVVEPLPEDWASALA